MKYREQTGLRYQDGVPIIDLGEDLSKTEGRNTLTDYVERVVKEGKKGVVLNFEEIGYVNSTTIGQIIRSYHSLLDVNNNSHNFLYLCKVEDRIIKLLGIVGLLKIEGISINEKSLDEAVAELSQQ